MSDEQLEGIDNDMELGCLQMGVVLDDCAHNVDVKLEDGDAEKIEDLVEPKGVA